MWSSAAVDSLLQCLVCVRGEQYNLIIISQYIKNICEHNISDDKGKTPPEHFVDVCRQHHSEVYVNEQDFSTELLSLMIYFLD